MAHRSIAALALVWLTLLGPSIALSALAAAHDTLPGDTGIMDWAQDRAFPGEALSDTLRSITFTELLLVVGAVLAAALWLRGYRAQALTFAVGLAVLPLLQAGLKELVDRPRPGPDLVELRASFSSPSFPSGHVMSATYVYGYLVCASFALPLAGAQRTLLGALSAVVLVLSGPTNVWLGVHWPSDVLGGYAWGAVLLLSAYAAGRVLARGGG